MRIISKTIKKIRRIGRKIVDFISIKTAPLKMFFKYGKFDFFDDIDIEVNTSCNRRCSYCPNSVYDRGLKTNERLMDMNLFKKIIDELAEFDYSGRLSPIFYGEPLLREDLEDLIGYARKKLPKARLKIISNGDLLTVERYKKLVEAGVSDFLVTEHGPKMSAVIEKLFEYFENNPGEKISFKYIKYDNDTPLYNRGGVVVPKKVDNFPRCLKPHNPLIVDWDGNVILCCNDYFSSVKFGNLKNQKLLDIWNSAAYKKLRKQLKNRDFRLDICKKCVGMN